MELTKEYLISMKASMEQQRNHAAATMQQASGAISMVDAMLARLDAPEAPKEPSGGEEK